MKKIFSFIFASSLLIAGGWDHPVQGIKGLGMGDAYTALSEDATAIWWNPGGLVFQKNTLEVNIGGTIDMPYHVWKFPDGQGGEKEANSNLITFVPQGFISFKKDKLAYGLGYYVAYGGGGEDWKQEDVGFNMKAVLGIMSITPALSYMVNENLGIGLRINIFYGTYENKYSNTLIITEAKGSGWGFSGGFGLLYKINQKLFTGLNFRAPFNFKFTGTYKNNLQGEFDTESKADFPFTVALGVGYKPVENLTFGFDFEYTNWKTLDYFITTIKTGSGNTEDTLTLLFNDAFKIKLGVEYKLPQYNISLRTGFAYDKAASPDSTLSPANIDVDKYVAFFGIGYDLKNFGIDFAVLKAFGKETSYTEEVAPGIFVTNKYNMNPIAIGFAVKFYK